MVAQAPEHRPGGAPDEASVPAGTSLREALARLVGSGAPGLAVVDADGRRLGHVSREAILDAARLDA